MESKYVLGLQVDKNRISKNEYLNLIDLMGKLKK
jgi:hypothetical protein